MKKNTGFTLIELLVVIAIIGILSSVVLASLNTARAKGADAATKSNLANLRAQAEIYLDGAGNGTYGTAGNCSVTAAGAPTTCTGNVTADLLAGLKGAAASSGATAYASVATNGTAWAAFAALKVSPGGNWCVDSTGASKLSASLTPASSTAC